jgi:hypothetical protein
MGPRIRDCERGPGYGADDAVHYTLTRVRG